MYWHSYALVILLLAGFTQTADRLPDTAAPSLILVYGGSMSEPVVLRNWPENGWLLSGGATTVTSDMLDGRPFFRLAFFWGRMWADYVASGKPLDALKPEQANQYGRFYPAIGFAEAFIAIDFINGPGTLIWHVSPEGLRLLAAQGVPVKLPLPPVALLDLVSSEFWPWIGLGLLCIGGIKLRRYQRQRQHRHRMPI
jgi:hypothetical protein